MRLSRRRLQRLPWEMTHLHAARAGSNVRRLAVQATHRHCNVHFDGPVHLGPGFSLHIPDTGTLEIGAGVEFRRGFHCEISGSGRVRIGAGTIFTSTALIQCTTTIDIGERCVFGQATLVADGNHRFRDYTRPFLEQGYDFRDITIGDGAVITTKCTIIASIGERAFIGANSVVSRDIPAWWLAAGAPARPLEYFGPPELRDAADLSIG